MQRLGSLAAWRELGGLAACAPASCAWKWGLTCSRRPPGVCARPQRAFCGDPAGPHGRSLRRRRVVFAGQKHGRLFSSTPGSEGPPESSGHQPAISVVGVPDPLTWIRCKAIMLLIEFYFELDVTSVEFDRGVKQALVHVSNMMSSGRYAELRGIVSHEMVTYVEQRCRSLGRAQRQQLAVSMDDIIFALPEDVSVVFDQHGRKFCYIVMRFWLLSAHDGPDDPEGTKIFKVAPGEGEGPQKRVATAVYEFHRELTRGASPDWTVTTVWHWHWKLAE